MNMVRVFDGTLKVIKKSHALILPVILSIQDFCKYCFSCPRNYQQLVMFNNNDIIRLSSGFHLVFVRLSLSFHKAFIRLSSGFHWALSGFCSAFIGLSMGFHQAFVRLSSGFVKISSGFVRILSGLNQAFGHLSVEIVTCHGYLVHRNMPK